jgi:hypothetical protein
MASRADAWAPPGVASFIGLAAFDQKECVEIRCEIVRRRKLPSGLTLN